MKKLNIRSAFALALVNVGAVYAPFAVGAAADGSQLLTINADIVAGTCIADEGSLLITLREVSVGELNTTSSASKALQLGGMQKTVTFTCPTGTKAALKIVPVNTAICETNVGSNYVCSTGQNKSVALRFKYNYPSGTTTAEQMVDASPASNIFKEVTLKDGKVAIGIGKAVADVEMVTVKDVPLEPGSASFEYTVEISSI